MLSNRLRSGRHFETEFAINDRRYARLPDIRRRQLMKFIRSEVMLIFFYVSAALLHRLIINNSSIWWMTFARWLTEGSFLPHTILTIVIGSYLDWWKEYLLETDPKLISILAYVTKGILFVIMRYTEMYPSSIINDYQTFCFYLLCNSPDLH